MERGNRLVASSCSAGVGHLSGDPPGAVLVPQPTGGLQPRSCDLVAEGRSRINYDGKIFRGRSNTPNGDVDCQTVFRYRQEGDRLSGEYSGGSVARGHLLGTVLEDGCLEFCYHHMNAEGALQAGECRSIPRRDADGTLILQEEWRWFTGDRSSGRSEVEEIGP